MSATEEKECWAGSYISTTGERSSGATTARTRCRPATWAAWSVSAVPSSTDGSVNRVLTAGTNPFAGPPERISSRTPVSTPAATSGPDTRLRALSTVSSPPSRWNSAPSSACGHQLDCTATVAGQTPARLAAPDAADPLGCGPATSSAAVVQAAGPAARQPAATIAGRRRRDLLGRCTARRYTPAPPGRSWSGQRRGTSERRRLDGPTQPGSAGWRAGKRGGRLARNAAIPSCASAVTAAAAISVTACRYAAPWSSPTSA